MILGLRALIWKEVTGVLSERPDDADVAVRIHQRSPPQRSYKAILKSSSPFPPDTK